MLYISHCFVVRYFLMEFTLFCCKIRFIAIHAVCCETCFVAIYALSVWRQITSKILSVEKKLQISCMLNTFLKSPPDSLVHSWRSTWTLDNNLDESGLLCAPHDTSHFAMEGFDEEPFFLKDLLIPMVQYCQIENTRMNIET